MAGVISLTMSRFCTFVGLVFVVACTMEPEEFIPEQAQLCLAPQNIESSAAIEAVPIFEEQSFLFPVRMIQPPNSDRWFVLEQDGKIYSFDPASPTTTELSADLSELVLSSGDRNYVDYRECGLLGLVFHPDFAQNRWVFINYTAEHPSENVPVQSIVSRFLMDEDGVHLDVDSELQLLSVQMPSEFHHGGTLEFGPDGYLYFSMGDGNDTLRAQDPHDLLGSILRIDISSSTEENPYAIPADNPFADGEEGAPEVYAYGFRNPWSFNIDAVTGDVWVGDVGALSWEEINLIRPGGNYGWPYMEGPECSDQFPDCDPSLYDAPTLPYVHAASGDLVGGAALAGYVYRGSLMHQFYGEYIFGDFTHARIWKLNRSEDGENTHELLLDMPISTAGFGQDHQGELYVMDYREGGLFALRPASSESEESTEQQIPTLISQTNCFTNDAASVQVDLVSENTNALQPRSKLIPYQIKAPLWSDGADKRRWISLPPDSQIRLRANGQLNFPVGTVLLKEFAFGEQRLETRYSAKLANGEWALYTYRWNDGSTEGNLLQSSAQQNVEIAADTLEWYYPSRGDCLQCHTDASNRVLGPSLSQLDFSMEYPTGEIANQIDKLRELDVLVDVIDASEDDTTDSDVSTPLDSFHIVEFIDLDQAGDIDVRARSYLHSNCSHCHQPGGVVRTTMDLRYVDSNGAPIPLAEMQLCDALPKTDYKGETDSKLLSPGQPNLSILLKRMQALPEEQIRMPPLSTALPHEDAIAVIEEWVATMDACPTLSEE